MDEKEELVRELLEKCDKLFENLENSNRKQQEIYLLVTNITNQRRSGYRVMSNTDITIYFIAVLVFLSAFSFLF